MKLTLRGRVVGTALILACLFLAAAIIGAVAEAVTAVPATADDRTPLSCDGHPADFHAERVKALAADAHSPLRILDASPAKARERRAWQEHRRCVLDRERRKRLGRFVEQRQVQFTDRFLSYISPPGMAWLDALGGCESDSSGGYWEDEDGGYGGRYQFDASTWAATEDAFEDLTGLDANPSRLALPREQDIRAAILYRQRGTAPWPSCA